HVVVVLLSLAVIAKHTHLRSQCLVVGGNGAGFATCTEVLAGVEAERGSTANRTGCQPAILFAGKILCAVGLASIFHHNQTESVRQFEDGIHVGHLPIEVDGNDRCHRAPAAAADHFARRISRAFLFEILPQLFGVHVVGALVDVHEFRQGTRLRNRLGCCDKRVRDCHRHIARTDTGRHQGKAQRVGAAVDCGRVPCFAEGGERLLEVHYHRSSDEAGTTKDLLEYAGELLLELNVRGNQIKKRNAGNAHLVTSEVCSIYRRNRAGLPATMALAGTSFVTTLPAPTNAFSPMVMFARMVQPEPTEAPFFTRVLSTFQSDSVCRPPSAVVARG